MLEASVVPSNRAFTGICQDELVWHDTIKLSVFFLFPFKTSSLPPHDLAVLRESTPRGRADLSAQMGAPPPTPPPTALSGR